VTLPAAVVALAEGLSLPVEVVAVLDVVDLCDELLLNGVARVKALKRHAHHTLKVIVGLLNLTDVDSLQL